MAEGKKYKVVEDFEAAVRMHEMMGAAYPKDHAAIVYEFNRAKAALVIAIARLERRAK